MKNKMLFVLALITASLIYADSNRKAPQPTDKEFYIFENSGSRKNRYSCSGYMGDYGDIKVNPRFKDNAPSTVTKSTDSNANTCLEIKYSAERKQGSGWAGIYWQTPANNWGDKKGGFDLSNYHKVTFWARGSKGGEAIDKFLVGGITGQNEDGDTDSNDTGAVELTKTWKQYTINLTGLDMSHIIGAFGWAANADLNPEGIVFYVDEIRYEN
jgi:hypothetical protein